MRFTVVLSVVVVAAALSSGCGVDSEHTALMWRSVQSSLGRASGHGQQQALTATFDFNVDCEESGSADLTAKLDVNDPIENEVNVLFGYDVRYNECQPDENTLDGELHYAAGIDAGASDVGAAVSIRTIYTGSVTSRGDTNGTCDIDVTGTVDASAGRGPGDEFASNVDIEYDGTICGHDAHEALSSKVDLGR